ncbi:MAG: 2-oxoacid:acceptor oxidoreductase family protein, partial [Burkholderiaceae bacterium]
QSIAAGVNITYKILYNDAVAMTGGQAIGERPEGHSVAQIAQSVLAEGAQQVRVVTDEPHKYPAGLLPAQAKVHHRDDLDDVQRQLREVLGTTVIIYDQTCATEKRRRRKRGKMVDPAKRVFINPEVCEGCGDCSVQSNCMSVEPLETPLGRKRTINQNTCNKDTSCLKGFCPSFVTVEGGQYVGAQTAAAPGAARQAPTDDLPWPELPGLQQPWGMLVAGVGGTGVITIGQLLGVAAHLEGKGVVTQDSAGLAQKGGATWAHAVIAAQQAQLHSTRVDVAAAHVVLGCDPIVAAGKQTLLRVRPGQTRVVLNSHATPTAGFVQHTEWQNPAQACAARVAQAVGEASLAAFDAHRVATQCLGDSIYINPMVLGF